MTKHFFVNGLTVTVGLLLMIGCASVNLPNPYPGQTTPNLTLTTTVEPIERGWLEITPLPGEKVTMGEPIEMQPLPPPAYAIHDDAAYPTNSVMTVTNLNTQEVFRLGNDLGSPAFYAITDKYLVWHWRCNCGDEMPSGIYARELASGKDILITGADGRAEVSGEWLIAYTYLEGEKYVSMHAHNIATGEDLPLAEAMPKIDNAHPASDFYAINEETIAWFEMDFTTYTFSLWVYDLRTHAKRQLAAPNLKRPMYISVSNDLVVWWDEHWQGYDLEKDAPFSISLIPPGWAKNKEVHNFVWVTAMGRYLYWSLESDGKTHYFLAPVGLPDEKVGPPAAMPTDTVVPTVVLPTLYPEVAETPRAPAYP